ncbi:MAG TPA: hypothetical protein VGM72_11945 [Micropepsaceae bacterium]
MMRLLFILIIAGVAALAAAWVADHDAVLTLTVADYEIRTTAAVAVVILLVCFFVLRVALRILFAVLKGLAMAGGQLSRNHRNATGVSRASTDAKIPLPREQPS